MGRGRGCVGWVCFFVTIVPEHLEIEGRGGGSYRGREEGGIAVISGLGALAWSLHALVRQAR